jgi:predicted metal-dependent HD superfamily phosphohydrolase
MTPDVRAAYGEPHRRYHTLAHVQDCLEKLKAVEGLSERDRRILEYAIWWHDAVYDARRSNNEEASAAMAERELAAMGVDEDDRREVRRLILLTKGHRVAETDRLGAILVSIDLSIFGADAGDYDAYARQVREEYAHVPDPAFRAGRAAVLKRFLAIPQIYPDPHLAALWEDRARATPRWRSWTRKKNACAATCSRSMRI